MSNDKRKRGLGKGLEALLADADAYKNASVEEPASVLGSVAHLPIAHIEANRFNPRVHFNEEALHELALSIAQHGVIQPITVRQRGNEQYEIISGERRFRASKIAGLTEIPAYVRPTEENDQLMLEMALIENIQREDLNAIEIAVSYERLMEECKLNQEELSDRVAKKRSTVANYLRLLKLPAEIQAAIRDSKISMGHARALAGLEDFADKQLAVFAMVLEENLSVRQTEDLVKNTKENPMQEVQEIAQIQAEKEIKKKEYAESERFESIKEQLCALFDTKVAVQANDKGKGKISIDFNNEADLHKILDLLGLAVG